MTRLSVLIPLFNAAHTVERLCESLIALYSQKFRLEIVLVNDGSRDDTDAACRRVYEKHKNIITYLKLSRNFGEHNALMAGLHHATGDYCVMMDDDFQNPPEEVEKLIGEILLGYDVVYAAYPRKEDGWFRNLGSKFNDKVANLVLRKPADLYLSSFKIINRFLIDEIIKYTGHDPYIDGIILRSTDNISKVSVVHRIRERGRSGYTLGKLVSIWGNMIVNFSMLPLRLLGIAGFLLVIISIIYGSYHDLLHADEIKDFEKLMSFNMFSRGLALLAVSVVGEYVGRIYLSLSKDPQFVVREMFSAGRRGAKVNYLEAYKGHNANR